MSSSDSSDIDPLDKGEATYVMESFRSSPPSSPQTPRPHKILITPPLVLNENSNEVSKDDFFHSFRLRRIVRENHGGAIHACAFFPRREKDVPRREDDGGNILATAGGLQVNFYDNEHCGDHLDIMSHFVVDGYGYAPSVEDPQDELKTLAWVPSDSDAVLAAGGSGGVIHVLSLTRSQELGRWNAHEGGITHLEIHPLDGNLLLSVGKDARVRLWNLGAKRALCEYHVKAVVSATFHPSGLTFLTSTSKGVVVQWEVLEDFIGMSDTDACRTKTRIFGEEGEAFLEEAPYIAGPFSYHTQSISKSVGEK
ncbi:WD40-repeat-containing domain protein [Geranomyces variabilis]|nr:WD40-repeat-containing domain protein [Geranomyces variabilis]